LVAQPIAPSCGGVASLGIVATVLRRLAVSAPRDACTNVRFCEQSRFSATIGLYQ
jgi:hypothetical protein